MDVLERDESEVSCIIYPSFEAGAAPAHRFGTLRRLRPFAMVPPSAPHNSTTAGGPARSTVPAEPAHSTYPARVEDPRPPITQDRIEHHFTKVRQELSEVVQVLLDQKAAGATKGQYSGRPEVGAACSVPSPPPQPATLPFPHLQPPQPTTICRDHENFVKVGIGAAWGQLEPHRSVFLAVGGGRGSSVVPIRASRLTTTTPPLQPPQTHTSLRE